VITLDRNSSINNVIGYGLGVHGSFPVRRTESSPRQDVHTGKGTHPTSNSICTMGPLLVDKVAGA